MCHVLSQFEDATHPGNGLSQPLMYGRVRCLVARPCARTSLGVLLDLLETYLNRIYC